MKKRALKLCAAALLILLVIYALIGNPIVFWHNRALEHSLCSLEDGITVTLNETVPFEWEAVYTFDPYTSKSEMERIIGISSSSIRETVSEGMVQLIFVNRGRVTASVCGYASNLGYDVYLGRSGRPLTIGEEMKFSVACGDGIVRLAPLSLSYGHEDVK